jgi:cardiolipin synthase
MKLIVQPEAGFAPVLKAIKEAQKSLKVLIFRLDRGEVARALEEAVSRGVDVRALTAHTNRGGDKSLRKLELQLLDAGVTVARTNNDLVRYHGKMMIIDDCTLHVYGFNFTRFEAAKCRSFGIITKNRKLVREAVQLFEADFNRREYVSKYYRFIVSPDNSRERLTKFIKGTRRELLIYDPMVSDDAILKVLVELHKSGVDVRIIGKVEAKWELKGEKLPDKGVHIRAIIRDGKRAFIGSQSLRKLELEKRREIGIVIDDRKVVNQIKAIFEKDWATTERGRKAAKKAVKLEKKEKREEKKEEKAVA